MLAPQQHSSLSILQKQHFKLVFLKYTVEQEYFTQTSVAKRFWAESQVNFFWTVLYELDKVFFPHSFWGREISNHIEGFNQKTQDDLTWDIPSLPTFEQSLENLEYFRSNKDKFLNIVTLSNLSDQSKLELYNGILLFLESLHKYLTDIPWVEISRDKVAQATQDLLIWGDIKELLSWFDANIFDKIKNIENFWNELTSFFQNKNVSDRFDYGIADKIWDIINTIYLLFLWKIDAWYLSDIEISYVDDLIDRFSSKKSGLRKLGYAKIDLPVIFWFLNDDNDQRSGYTIHVIESLLKDFSKFLSMYKKEK